MVVEDLFASDPPKVYDLGTGAPYKEMFSTESYLESNVFLFRPGFYLRFAQEGHRACKLINNTVSVTMDRLHLKSILRKLVRGQTLTS